MPPSSTSAGAPPPSSIVSFERGFLDVSVLDVSTAALEEARRRVGDAPPVHWLHEDILVWRPEHRFDLWHDRATFHFLVDPEARDAYLATLRSAIRAEGFGVFATFAPDGPESCSGLPVARYSAADLSRLLGAGFDLLETRREEHVTPDATAAVHLGGWADTSRLSTA